MNSVFDVNELRANIGSDCDIESKLLASFIESSKESLDQLTGKFPNGEDNEYNMLWKSHMHQMKGAAMNICADNLTKITAAAQNQYADNLTVKKQLLESVTKELDAVKASIRNIYPQL